MSQGPKIIGVIILLASLASLTGTGAILSQIYLYGPPASHRERSGPPQAHPEQLAQKPRAEQQGTLERPLVVRTIKTAEEAQQEAEERKEKSSNDRLLVVFTGSLVLVTAALVAYTGVLSHATQQLVRDGKATAERQLRAYIAVESMGDQSKMMVGQPPTIHLRVVNTGQTPARNVVIWNRAEIFATYPPPVLDWSRPKENIEGKSIHGRGDDAIMIRRETPVRPQGVPITPDEEAEMKAGTKEFHGWGEIIYEDVFEREWFTKFHVTFGGPDSYTLKRLRTPYEGNEST